MPTIAQATHDQLLQIAHTGLFHEYVKAQGEIKAIKYVL
jgi:hypothetical protein